MSITNLESRWSDLHRRYSNNPERFNSVDGSVETWSREITRPEDLPADCAAVVSDTFQTFPYCVRTPVLGVPGHQDPESFLCLGGSTLMVLKRDGKGLSTFQCDLDDIDSLATETALLQSCITFQPRDGKPVPVPFNTVVEDLFTPVVNAFLKAKGASVQEVAQLDAVRPDPLEDLRARDHKYYTYALEVLPEDGVKSRFYHPTEAVPNLINRSRQIPSYLLAASEAMVYILSGKEPFRAGNASDYSLVVRYLPITDSSALSYSAIPGERGHRMVTFWSGSAAVELPLARSADWDFAAFATAVQLPVLPAGELNPALEAQRRRKVG